MRGFTGILRAAAMVLAALVSFPAWGAPGATNNAAGIEFFEKNIRPVLATSCYSCHSQQANKHKGGLLLDTREGLLKGGDTGPALVAGHPEKSLLIKAIRQTDKDLVMPPKDPKLPEATLALFEKWVAMGAPDPRTGTNAVTNAFAQVMIQGRKHWAFRPVVQPPLPKTAGDSWVENPVDAFVLDRLRKAGMKPSARADKRTLLRRVAFDLTGLPPTTAEMESFLSDDSREAYARAVDRLLGSPGYGERWARHWLDVARYADTKGYVGGNEETRFPFSYTYRDYVIRSFNEDLPYDRFLIEQLAADLLPVAGDNRSLAALGFLTLGRRFVNNEHDIIDDRIDVIGRGTMGLTVGCARCHDHKYEPIPTQDYYSLFGVLHSSMEPVEKPVLDHQGTSPEHPKYLAELSQRQAALKSYVSSNETFMYSLLRSQVGDYLQAIQDTATLTDVKTDEVVRGRKLNMTIYRRWKESLAARGKTNDPVFSPWITLAAVPPADFGKRAGEMAPLYLANPAGTNQLNPKIAALFQKPPTNITDLASAYGKLFTDVNSRWAALVTNVPAGGAAPAAFPDPSDEALRQVLHATGSPANPTSAELITLNLLDDGIKNRVEVLKREVVALDVTHPGAPARAMVLQDKPAPINYPVLIRGNPGTPGPPAPRRFLEILSSTNRPVFSTTNSGRLDLARAISSSTNPLTARVFVNRVWLHHFGAGLVRTPSDFGIRSEPPTHPELLDYLAARFVADGWSVKKLHRLILLSATYQQASAPVERFVKKDPDNRLLWRMTPRRLDFEAMRDSLLAVSGRLEPVIGGRPADIMAQPFTGRRTVYSFIDRQELPNVFRTFDFANPDTSNPRRYDTTVAQQALFLMNSSFAVQMAQRVVAQSSLQSATNDAAKISRLYSLLFQRAPSPGELRLGEQFIQQQPVNDSVDPGRAAWSYGYGIYDIAKRKVQFTPFAHFSGANWQATGTLPDPQAGWALLNAEGGQPGKKFGSIRRWTAPEDGRVDISGTLAHATASGDGVEGWVVSSRNGLLGHWIAHNTNIVTRIEFAEVKASDTLDFMVTCRENENFDGFKWAPVIERRGGRSLVGNLNWSAQTQFGDNSKLPKPLAAWEKYAQVLLLSNEFVFVE